MRSFVRRWLGVFAVFHVGVQILGFFWDVAKHVATILSPIAGAFLTIGAAIGDALVNFDSWLESSGIFSGWLDKVVKFLEPVAVWFEKAGASILSFFGLAIRRPKPIRNS